MTLTLLVSAGVLAGCASPGSVESVTAIDVPGGGEAGMYSLAAGADGKAYLSWLDASDTNRALRFSVLDGGQWSASRTIVEGAHVFSNWADHPSIAAMDDGTLVAQWPVINAGKPTPGSYNNSIRVAVSRDEGATWTEVFADGLDNVHSYSGFMTLLPGARGFSAIYLTPPRPISHDPADHVMTLSHMTVDAGGRSSGPTVVDEDTCSCCPTAFASTADGPIAVYRDHEPGEIRDIAVVRLVEGQWTTPRPVHRDGWRLNGCPTNGPDVAADGRDVAVAWFTAAGDAPRMQVAFSRDAGATFDRPAVVDGGNPIGRAALVMLPDRSAVVAWLDGQSGGAAALRLRRVTAAGRLGPVVTAGAAPSGRAVGMPQMVRLGDSLLLVWRGQSGLQAARVPVSLL